MSPVPSIIYNPNNPMGARLIYHEAVLFQVNNPDLFGLPPVAPLEADWFIPANQLALDDMLFPPPLMPLYQSLDDYIVVLTRFYQEKMNHFAHPP